MTGKIDLIPNNLIDRERWDMWVRKAINRRIYATSTFLDIFSPRWQAMVINDGEYFMPVTWNMKFGISYVFQPIFVQQLGCFSHLGSCSDVLPGFIDKLKSSFRFIDISLNEQNRLDAGNQCTELANFLLRMDRPYESITRDYSINTRRNIIKSERLGLVLLPHYTARETVRMFALNSGRLYRNIRRKNYSRLLRLIELGLSEGFLQIKAARSMNGDIIAAACFLEDFDRYVFYFSANTEEGRNQGAMFFLIDSFIKQNSGTGKHLDFNGSVNSNIARFYQGFGAEGSSYQRLKINRLDFPLNLLKR